MIGRCVAGVGVGFTLMVAHVYAAEISAPGTRGFLTSLPELCISLGILLGYVSNYFFAKLPLELGWRLMLGVAAIPALALTFGILRMPESPRWLVMQGRLRDAKQILLKVSNTEEEAESRLKDIKIATRIELILRPSPMVRWVLLAAIGIHFFEHATGIEALVLYSPRIFKHAGITSKNKLLLAIIGVGVIKSICILIATLYLDKIGRRKLLFTSIGGMILALSTLGFSLTIVQHSPNQRVLWALSLSIAAIYLYVMFFSIGLGPITWVYSSEIFPLKLRAQGASLVVAMNRVMNAIVSMTFLSITKAITIGGTFFMFAGITVVAWIFCFFFLPETKGRSLEEMEALFTRGRKQVNVGMELQPGKL